jgi:hypothetical protein
MLVWKPTPAAWAGRPPRASTALGARMQPDSRPDTVPLLRCTSNAPRRPDQSGDRPLREHGHALRWPGRPRSAQTKLSQPSTPRRRLESAEGHTGRRQMPEQTRSRLGPPRSGYASRACEAGPAHGVRTAPVFLRQLPPRIEPDSAVSVPDAPLHCARAADLADSTRRPGCVAFRSGP